MDRFKKNISRRAFSGTALAAGAFAATRAMAQGTVPAITPNAPMERFFPQGYRGESDFDMASMKGHDSDAAGEIIEIRGRVTDRNGRSFRKAELNIWQANSFGRYAHDRENTLLPLDPDFQGFAKLETNSFGDWKIRTIKPGAYDSPRGRRAPHIHLEVLGETDRLTAQLFFSDEAEANAADYVYQGLGADAAKSVARLAGPGDYRWDIVLMDDLGDK